MTFDKFLLFQEEKHVGFIMEDGMGDDEGEENLDGEEKRNLKLQRRDTPHHLKNKRIVTESTDSEAIRAILQKVRRAHSQALKKPFQYFIKFDIILCHFIRRKGKLLRMALLLTIV